MASVEGVERVIARFSRARFCACAEVNEESGWEKSF
jgi:hypothetical protein